MAHEEIEVESFAAFWDRVADMIENKVKQAVVLTRGYFEAKAEYYPESDMLVFIVRLTPYSVYFDAHLRSPSVHRKPAEIRIVSPDGRIRVDLYKREVTCDLVAGLFAFAFTR